MQLQYSVHLLYIQIKVNVSRYGVLESNVVPRHELIESNVSTQRVLDSNFLDMRR